ncbi:MAG: hypothetical protein N2688_00215 [Burkholderiaceae bacterium]|nr:hypothetical protein [Burkholderiaceae bacterium]
MSAPEPARPGVSPAAPVFDAALPLQRGGLMLGLPAYGGLMYDACVRGLLDLQQACHARGLGFSYCVVRNESLVQRARNRVVAEFLASDCSHLLFVDSDIGFTAHAALRLLAHDRPLIGGLYRKKSLERVEFAANWWPSEDGTAPRDPRTGAIRVLNVATGFMAIRRDVILRMVEAFPQLRYEVHPAEGEGAWTAHLYALFDCWIDPATRSYWSEDYGFCARWRALGGEVWADPGIVLEHWGATCFRADPMEFVKVVEQP